MSLADIRAGLASNVDTLDALHTYSGYTPDAPTPPAAVVAVTEVVYGDTMGHGTTRYMVDVVLFIEDGDPESSQSALDALLEPTGSDSIIAAIESDRTLGGAAATLHVGEAVDLGRVELGNVTAITATLKVEVFR